MPIVRRVHAIGFGLPPELREEGRLGSEFREWEEGATVTLREKGGAMAEETALLRALHFEQVAMVGLMFALFEEVKTESSAAVDELLGDVDRALSNARKYYEMAQKEAANDA